MRDHSVSLITGEAASVRYSSDDPSLCQIVSRLAGTHQGAVSHEHLGYYLDEYTFRFNRRTSSYRGKLFYRLLQNAVVLDPVRYDDLTLEARDPKPKHKI